MQINIATLMVSTVSILLSFIKENTANKILPDIRPSFTALQNPLMYHQGVWSNTCF